MDIALHDQAISVLEAKTKLVKFCDQHACYTSESSFVKKCASVIEELSEQVYKALLNPDLLRVIKAMSTLYRTSDKLILELFYFILPSIRFGKECLKVKYKNTNGNDCEVILYDKQLTATRIIYGEELSEIDLVAATLRLKRDNVSVIGYVIDSKNLPEELNFDSLKEAITKFVRNYIYPIYKNNCDAYNNQGCLLLSLLVSFIVIALLGMYFLL